MIYDVRPIQAPRSAGGLLRVMTALVENSVTGSLLGGMLLKSAGVVALRQVAASEPLPVEPPVFTLGEAAPTAVPVTDPTSLPVPSVPAGAFHFTRADEYVAAYRAGTVTPLEVAERVLEASRAADADSLPLRIFIAQARADLLAQAEAATARYRTGTPCGPLDGVPVAVKDELDQVPYPTTVGTRFLGTQPAREDAEVVARLRAAGALLIGKANMHEIGLGVTGNNPHHGACRNPYDPTRATGGSSSGPAAAVAHGLCPIAVGADGGGSIRIPAAFCGVVGLKATFGRLSERGAAPVCWSLAHVGPIAATARDAALAYAIMAGRDPRDPNTLHQPPVDVSGLDRAELGDLRLGVFPPWFEDADPAIVAACRAQLDRFVAAGARVQEITLPELGSLRTVHMVTIVSEMATAHLHFYRQHRTEYGLDTRLNLVLARRLRATDYNHAQRVRARLTHHFLEALRQVDVIVTPATGCLPPPIPTDALRTGESNLPLLDRIMRFAPAANLAGLPAIAFPVGYTEAGLPLAMQLIGRAWDERRLLQLAFQAESQLRRQSPARHCRILS